MGVSSIWHWLIVLVIVLLVFGTKRLRGLGSDLGSAIKSFRSAMSEGESTPPDATAKQIGAQDKPTTPSAVSGESAKPDQSRLS